MTALRARTDPYPDHRYIALELEGGDADSPRAYGHLEELPEISRLCWWLEGQRSASKGQVGGRIESHPQLQLQLRRRGDQSVVLVGKRDHVRIARTDDRRRDQAG